MQKEFRSRQTLRSQNRQGSDSQIPPISLQEYDTLMVDASSVLSRTVESLDAPSSSSQLLLADKDMG